MTRGEGEAEAEDHVFCMQNRHGAEQVLSFCISLFRCPGSCDRSTAPEAKKQSAQRPGVHCLHGLPRASCPELRSLVIEIQFCCFIFDLRVFLIPRSPAGKRGPEASDTWFLCCMRAEIPALS